MRNIAVLTGVVVFVLDQLTKVIVVHWMNLKSVGAIDVLPPVLNLRMAWNRGINFGLMANDNDLTRWVLIALALVISAWVVWWIRKEGGNRWALISAGLLVGGALGNVIDRILYGAVADFLNMSCCGYDNPYAFNVADISIFAGAIGLIVFTGEKKTS
ncbi:MAG: signal peptidase II [Rhodobacteraceae bacterium]|nr:signal peptidase II [Alphaproteobacteria bacterium]MBT8476433.1 signal peptidase II [Alphaproteobacteria bacterium]NNF70952.1 signal peptidase II [Paracoccaceae bacterium]NNK65389.1 signal peptidase II [Paracoccaceae bacterium]